MYKKALESVRHGLLQANRLTLNNKEKKGIHDNRVYTKISQNLKRNKN